MFDDSGTMRLTSNGAALGEIMTNASAIRDPRLATCFRMVQLGTTERRLSRCR